MSSMQLDALERAALGQLLAGEHPVLGCLRDPLARAQVSSREFTGVGFFTELVLPMSVARVPFGRLVIHDCEASVEGLTHGAGFGVFVLDGVLNMLEGFSYGETWPESVGRFSLRYSDPRRRQLHERLGEVSSDVRGP